MGDEHALTRADVSQALTEAAETFLAVLKKAVPGLLEPHMTPYDEESYDLWWPRPPDEKAEALEILVNFQEGNLYSFCVSREGISTANNRLSVGSPEDAEAYSALVAALRDRTVLGNNR